MSKPRCEVCGNDKAAIVQDDGEHDWFCVLGCDAGPEDDAVGEIAEAEGRDELPHGVARAYEKAFRP